MRRSWVKEGWVAWLLILAARIGPCHPKFKGDWVRDPSPHRPFNPGDFDMIFFQHMRKAGGTTVASFLRQAAKHHKLKSSSCCTRGSATVTVDNASSHGPRTLLVTNLREPVDRAWSEFLFEGRWPHTFRDNIGGRHLRARGMRTTATAKTYSQWCEGAERTNAYFKQHELGTTPPRPCHPTGTGPGSPCAREVFLWQCCSECLVKWLGALGPDIQKAGTERPWASYPIGLAHQRRALETIKRFHLVVLLEKLHSPDYQDWLTGLFGPDFRPSGRGGRGAFEWHHRPGTAASALAGMSPKAQALPTTLDRRTRDEMVAANPRDIALFEALLGR